MRRIAVLGLAVAACGCARQVQVGSPGSDPTGAAITSADQLLAAMHDRYAGTWYRNLTFIQKSTFYRPDGTVSREETWYEAAIIPGRLRIDLGEPSRGNGALYRSDSLYSFQENRIATRRSGRNPLAILGFDVYGQSPARTLRQLRDERIDITLLRTDTLNGKRVYVVGAAPGDSTSNQFWVEADRFLFVRLIQSNADRTRTQDTRFEKYVAHGGGWVAEEVRVLVGGRVVFSEVYSNVRVNVELDDGLFIPEKWSAAKHWYTP